MQLPAAAFRSHSQRGVSHFLPQVYRNKPVTYIDLMRAKAQKVHATANHSTLPACSVPGLLFIRICSQSPE